MINGFSGYKETEVKEFGPTEKVEVGGHICKVVGVETSQYTSKKDGTAYNQLNVKFDLEAPDKQAGFYGKKFAEDAKKDALTAKWKGCYRLTIPEANSADFIKSNWKAFLTSIEKSNPGVVIDGEKGFEETILVGKLFGGIFGLEEFTLPDGKTITFSRLRFARSVENIEEAPIPKVRLVDNTYVDYEEYMNGDVKKENDTSNDEFGTIDDDSLPF